MKRLITSLAFALIFSLFFISCGDKGHGAKSTEEVKEEEPAAVQHTYTVSITPVQDDYATPALQSFVHATYEGDWLLFAGRTNGNDTIGGLHNLNADYSLVSFPPKSFNPFIYTFNPETGNQSHLNYWNMLNTINFIAAGGEDSPQDVRAACSTVFKILSKYASIFLCSNPQSVQDGNYLYVIGGYGPPPGETPTKGNYTTFDAIARINVPLLMRISQRDWSLTAAEWLDLFRFGNNANLQCTGGELKKAKDYFYLAGGQNFNKNQPYLNGVYEFTFADDPSTLALTVNIHDTISDLPDSILANNPKKADSTSHFRRRDLPVVSALYTNKSGHLEPGLAFMGGVFKYGKKLAAWNDAIYITPNGATTYFVDPQHDQKNHNVYACPDFAIYDTDKFTTYTFLPGGIGDGTTDKNLSPFTNTLGYAEYNLESGESSFKALDIAFQNTSYFYGAEAEFIPTSKAVYFAAGGQLTDVIDGKQTCPNSTPVHIGYIYGGIESYIPSPHTYGSGKSGASNKLWKVMLTRNVPIKN